ncbi:Os02g0250400 [Oryza sativa Japonica Group]|uniref:Os02g0250400 protein n=1 Tax=Oryza sativa subsp. japonica TaxID=39947 RepID=B7EI90_ORYSJ|nr:hypothetical protein EE612_010121 [Oryza sativa]BAG92087.1 unnamed protein product [Oryza sativa Japonica Group]BAS77910.1 Os02g0250400 [Oryza sativa Japonica Group]
MGAVRGILVVAVVLAVAAILAGAAEGKVNGKAKGKYRALFNFGDSLADAGNLLANGVDFRLATAQLPYGQTFPGHPTGRCSDGRLVVDHLGAPLGFSARLDFDVCLLCVADGLVFWFGSQPTSSACRCCRRPSSRTPASLTAPTSPSPAPPRSTPPTSRPRGSAPSSGTPAPSSPKSSGSAISSPSSATPPRWNAMNSMRIRSSSSASLVATTTMRRCLRGRALRRPTSSCRMSSRLSPMASSN